MAGVAPAVQAGKPQPPGPPPAAEAKPAAKPAEAGGGNAAIQDALSQARRRAGHRTKRT
jgi:hypothetical protein